MGEVKHSVKQRSFYIAVTPPLLCQYYRAALSCTHTKAQAAGAHCWGSEGKRELVQATTGGGVQAAMHVQRLQLGQDGGDATAAGSTARAAAACLKQALAGLPSINGLAALCAGWLRRGRGQPVQVCQGLM